MEGGHIVLKEGKEAVMGGVNINEFNVNRTALEVSFRGEKSDSGYTKTVSGTFSRVLGGFRAIINQNETGKITRSFKVEFALGTDLIVDGDSFVWKDINGTYDKQIETAQLKKDIKGALLEDTGLGKAVRELENPFRLG